MANIVQSKFAKNMLTPPRPQSAGAVHSALFRHSIVASGLATTDILELGVLPAGAKLVDWIFWTDAAIDDDVNIDVGIMSGEVGSTATDRTSGDELFDGVAAETAHTTILRPTVFEGFAVAASNSDRSIGLKVDATCAAGANKIVNLRIFYVQGELQ